MEQDGITGRIIACAMQVHTVLGTGYREVIYQRALSMEMNKQKLSFVREMVMNIYYDNTKIGSRRVDFFVENQIMVEIKAVSVLDNVHLAQIINYLHMHSLPFGLLINFGSASLIFKRVYNTQHIDNLNYRQ